MLQPTPLALATLLLLASASFIPAGARADPEPTHALPDDKGIYSFSLENDIFAGSDSDYTNGVRFAYVSPESHVPGWLERTADALPFFDETGRKRWSFAFGQNIYTPSNISTSLPQPNDEPYAGWLYGTAGVMSDTGRTLDTFEITLGMVGPASGAEQTQEFVHSLIGSPHPQGWQYQLHNEPGIIVAYQRKWHDFYQASPFGWAFDITPSVGGELGNIFTQASVGTVARLGRHLPEDYGPPLIEPSVSGSEFFVPGSDEIGWYFFGGLEGHLVARNIFLDGNTFEDSPSVTHNVLVGGVQGGLAVTIGETRISYTHVLKSEEFHEQQHLNQYGALTVSRRF